MNLRPTDGDSWFLMSYENRESLKEFLEKNYNGLHVPHRPAISGEYTSIKVIKYKDTWIIDHCHVRQRCLKCRWHKDCKHYNRFKHILE